MNAIILNDGSENMESLELRIFIQVANARSITKAAENMGYVQSNITAHMKKLEAELHTTLFIRGSRGITLTSDGEKLLYQAENIIAMIENCTASFKKAEKHLHICATQTIAGYLLPQCLIAYQKKYPDTTISVHTCIQDEKILSAQHKDCDLIITNRSAVIPSATHIAQYKEKLVIITPQSCQSIEDIKDDVLITNHISTCPYRRILMDWWNTNHKVSCRTVELDTVEAIINMVGAGGGISLLPMYVVENRHDINSFYLEEHQQTSLQVWNTGKQKSQECEMLKEIIEAQLM